ncbi:MAG: hypothetical protein JOY62_07770 [Acidobacteriaceae bacterium]|nr:hypothetical protein [Acidobacteriaceae bacterium]MBV9779857.1 hypothetical protein [Acidobacteriaceae bacterium]
MSANTISGHVYTARSAEEISAEISNAFTQLKKSGYLVTFLENQQVAGELLITFALGEAQQTVRIDRYEWKKPGSVTKIVVDKLNI